MCSVLVIEAKIGADVLLFLKENEIFKSKAQFRK